MSSMAKPKFDRRIFWDVNPDKIDFDGKASWVIARVFSRGDVEDIRQCRRHYGDGKVREVLLATRFLPEHRLSLAAAVINEPVEKFRCYMLKQSNPTHFPY